MTVLTDRAELVELTRDLVSIPSHENESRAGDRIETWLADRTDARVTRDEAGNVIARSALDGSSLTGDPTTLALVGHHDVVPPDDTQLAAGDGDDECVVENRNGRLYGRGTADMKGALAAAMCAFRDVTSASGGDERATEATAGEPTSDAFAVDELVFASFVGEERGGVGARHAIEEGFAPTYAIVGEGSTNYSGADVTDVVVAHKGRRASTVTTRGETAHASEPAAGENAIYRAGDVLDEIREIEAPTVEVAGDRLEGSVVATEIEGGSAWNVIPDSCTITIDERTVPGERAPLGTIEREAVEWTIDQDLPPMACSSEEFAEAVYRVAVDAQEGDPEQLTKPHATDAGWLAEAGTACVICGPSEPGEAHTETESASIAVLERCCSIYRNAAEAMV